jgi:hypothetical protein
VDLERHFDLMQAKAPAGNPEVGDPSHRSPLKGIRNQQEK